MNPLPYAVFAVGVASLALMVTVLVLAPRSPLNRAVALAGLFNGIWALCVVVVIDADPATALVAYHWSYTGALFVVPSMFGVHLLLAGVPARWRWPSVVAVFGFSVFLLVQYLSHDFYYAAFRAGPWGNVGLPSNRAPWASISPPLFLAVEMLGFVLLRRARRRADSHRRRAQLALASSSIPATYLLYGLAWALDEVLTVPPLEVLTGTWTMVVLLILMVRYRYLRQDELVETYLASALQDAVVLLDRDRAVLGANPVALERLGGSDLPLIGQDFAALLDEPQAFAREWERARSRQVLHASQPHLLGARTVRLTLSPLYGRSGEFEGATVLLGDLSSLDENARDQRLSPREKQVLVLLMQGQNHRQMARELDVTPGTIKTHTHKIFEKTGARNRTELFARLLKTPAPE